MTLSYFCGHCGIKTEGNTHAGVPAEGYYTSCQVCGFTVRFQIMMKANKTDEEIEKAFQDTPLTDSQRGTKRFKKK